MFFTEKFLRLKYGLSPQEPTEEQHQAINEEFNHLLESKQMPTSEDFEAIVKEHCTTYQQFPHKQSE
ncbi:hypothetical protein ACN469_05095 [Corallococcus terminator]